MISFQIFEKLLINNLNIMKTKSLLMFKYSCMLGVLLLFKTVVFCQDTTQTVTDIDGNVYHTVKIGTQTWMVEDLKVTKYNSGMPIQNITDSKTWCYDISGAFSWYNNDPSNKSAFGALYNWYAVNKGNLAPKGWHIPTVEEWQILFDYLGGTKIAGGKMKASGTSFWQAPNKGADNSSGFTAIPGGIRAGNEGGMDFSFIGNRNCWWTSTKSNLLQARYIGVMFNSPKAFDLSASKNFGFAVRCIKD